MLKIPIEVDIAPLKLEFDQVYSELEEFSVLQERKPELLAVWHASPFIKRVCSKHKSWLVQLIKSNELHKDFDKQIYEALIQTDCKKSTTVEEFQQRIRNTRQQQFARIAWRDLQNYSTTQQTLTELSAFADTCINYSLQWCFEWLQSRPHLSSIEKSLSQKIVVFALGKLGGSELNFSSDVDLVFAYCDDKPFTQEQLVIVNEFYLKLVQLEIKVLSEQTEHGFTFRVDTRLRPFGNSGALLPSFSAIEQYFQTHGRDWERYAWLKARVAAGDIQSGEKFLVEISSFIYRRYLDYGAMQSLREMKTLVDQKAKKNIKSIDIKIGPGGIREIEFITQMFQLIYGGRDKSLRVRPTLKALEIFKKKQLISMAEIDDLINAYLFLRKAENALQYYDDQQTHQLPISSDMKLHYAYMLQVENWEIFYKRYLLHTEKVAKVFQSLLLAPDTSGEVTSDNEFEKIWSQIEDEQLCKEKLSNNFGEYAEKIYQQLQKFSESSLIKQLIPLAQQRLNDFMPIMLEQLLGVSKPELVLERFLKILLKIAQRSTYISLLAENKANLKKLFILMQSSPWFAQYVSQHPILLDELLRLDESDTLPNIADMKRQLGINVQSANEDLEAYMERLREFKHSQVLQIAAADIIEQLPIMKVSDHLSWLAEVCLDNAVERAYQDLVTQYGEPVCIKDNGKFIPELLIVEYGKLGGLELSYASDLDIVFLHNSLSNQETAGSSSSPSKKISNEMFFMRLVQRTIHLLTTSTGSGKVFEIDMRLRPYGESGPVVTTLSAYKKYLAKDAWLWEHQALIRARPISKNQALVSQFFAMRKNILCQMRELNDVRTSVKEMRDKMLVHHGSKDENKFNLKKDRGGIIDIEFMVQYLVLAYANKHEELCIYTDNVRILEACANTKIIDTDSAHEIKEIYLKFRKQLHQLNLQLEPEYVTQDQFKSERLVIQNHWSNLLH